ncbi:hypothetical protein HYH02_015349, partial [Chlamydomonas schloesseri]
MGCGASIQQPPGASPIYVEWSKASRDPAQDLPLSDWDREEVSGWFQRLVPGVQAYGAQLLPEEGYVVATWTLSYLVEKGVPAADARRIIAYRDRAMQQQQQQQQQSQQQSAARQPLRSSQSPSSSIATPAVGPPSATASPSRRGEEDAGDATVDGGGEGGGAGGRGGGAGAESGQQGGGASRPAVGERDPTAEGRSKT